MEGGKDAGATDSRASPATKRKVEQRDAPPVAVREGTVVEGAASRAAEWFAALNIRDFFDYRKA